ncbi:hypothetical protein ACSBR2_005352 [Camellia fascicularis]
MDDLSHAIESLIAVGSESDNTMSELMLSDDQYFLLFFIMGTFFGPDLRGEMPQKSVLQRYAERLPSYNSNQLVGSHIKTIEVERVYYYVLRKADQSVIVKLPLLRQFFYGNLPVAAQYPAAAYPQFPDLFPPRLHPHSWFDSHKIIGNIIFINNPEISYIRPEDIERFKRLTGLEDFLLDRDCARLHTCVNGEALFDVAVLEVKSNGELPPPRSSQDSPRSGLLNNFIRNEDCLQSVHVVKPVSGVPNNGVPYSGTPMTYNYMAPLPAELDTRIVERFEPGMVFLPSPPTKEEWENIGTSTRSGSALTGTAAMGHIGPVIGLMDIGECDDSYLFRVSLPGVKRDEREFSCEVENDGKVLIRGVTTTGERTVYRHSQAFEMQTQNFCPPGHFSISFKLPGPVDPQQFSGNFGTDGILEGIVMKGI